MPVWFGLWCVAENCLVRFFLFDFLLCVTNRNGRRFLPVWMAGNALLTCAAVLFHFPGAFVLDVLVLALFARIVPGVRGAELIVPVTIIFTFSSFFEGCSAFVLSWLAAHFRSPFGGMPEQIFVQLVLDFLFFAVLRSIKRKYVPSLRLDGSSCLYLLLLPCFVVVLGVRCGLRLDCPDFARYLCSLGIPVRVWVSAALLAGAGMVFLFIEAFCKIVQFDGQGQSLAEANRRNRVYASLQHDIDNHLLVISGLLHDRLFAQAVQYTDRLREQAEDSLLTVNTGVPALDVLLRNKLSRAVRSQVKLSCHVAIPADFSVRVTDLCAVFSNVLDNAVAACLELPLDKRRLSVSADARSRLLLVEAVNSTAAVQTVPFGTGLDNVRRIARRYHGSVETELKDGWFRISVLLCSP